MSRSNRRINPGKRRPPEETQHRLKKNNVGIFLSFSVFCVFRFRFSFPFFPQ